MDSMSHGRIARNGLSETQARRKLAEHGPNELPGRTRRNLLRIGLEVLREPMLLLLVVGVAIYLAIGDLREALILMISVVVVIGITIFQERKTERALEALRDLSSPRALVIRDGVHRRIAGREVVSGDLLMLAEGDRVPADAVVLESTDLSLDESLLTGESLAVDKHAASEEPEAMGKPGEAGQSFVYSGSLVVRGQGIARVLATGLSTELGRIGKALQSLEVQSTPLQIQIARAVRILAGVGLLLCALVVVLYSQLRGGWLDGLLAGITLAMAMLPEEFPVVLTVFLALGAWRISKHRVLTRRMPAIETLGSATVLCVDKTGTLTENRMAVTELVNEQAIWTATQGTPPAPMLQMVRTAGLACEINPFDPMEIAIVDFAEKADAASQLIRTSWKLVREYDLTRDLLAVTHCWQRAAGGEVLVASKGAPETIVKLCRANAVDSQRILEQVATLAASGRRVLAVAHGRHTGDEFPESAEGFELTYLGLIGLSDPVRANVPAAIRECYQAGMRVMMITGDYPGTAMAIAEQIGLESPGGVVSGDELAGMTADELRARVRDTNVFARVQPEQKLLLVHALMDSGEIVAMTGDGVNDAPALKAAHIGVAMGRRGTDVAREAAALVLLDDDFKSIVEAVRLGRRIYENIRNAMIYLLAVHVPIAGMALLPLLFGLPLVFAPVHIVFFEFVIDPACSIVFEAERAEQGLMKRPPRNPREPLFGARLLTFAILQGLVMLAAIALLYIAVLDWGFAEARARAIAFAALVLGNIGLILSDRSQTHSIIRLMSMSNPALWWLIGGASAALVAAIYLSALQDIFRIEALSAGDFALALAAASAGVIWSESIKAFRRRHRATVVRAGATR